MGREMVEGELFSSVPSFLPVLQSGETLFSWGGRYHRRCSNARAQDSSRILFGDAKAGLRHDFPSHVGGLASAMGQAGSGNLLILRHTIFGFLAKFLDPETTHAALAMMLGPSVATLKHRLGLPKSGSGAGHPLKACRECIASDMDADGGAIWYLEHQWPTVWICRRHGTPLSHVYKGAQTRDRSRWMLPDSIAKTDWIDLPPLSDHQLAHLNRIATLTRSIAEAEEASFDLAHLRLAYLLGAKVKGLVVMSDGSIRFQQLLQAVRAGSADLVDLPGWNFLKQVEATHGGFVGVLMRRYPGNHYANKHVALIDFLFDSFDDFIAAYRRVSAAAANDTVDEIYAEFQSTLQRVLHDVQAEGRSVNQAAANAGIHAAQAVAWVKRAGIPYQRRPRVIDKQRKARLLRMLLAGRSREEITEKLFIKKSWLRAFLADNAEIRERWREKVESARCEMYRKHFLQLVAAHRGVPMKQIKALPGSGFTWLYRHDRPWLMANLPLLQE